MFLKEMKTKKGHLAIMAIWLAAYLSFTSRASSPVAMAADKVETEDIHPQIQKVSCKNRTIASNSGY